MARLQLEQTSRRESQTADPSDVLCSKEVDGFLKQQGTKSTVPQLSMPLSQASTEQGVDFSSTLQVNGGAEGEVTLLSTTLLWVIH